MPLRASEGKHSHRGEIEITAIIEAYHKQNNLNVEPLGRGTAWLDTGSNDGLLDAAEYVRVIEKRQGLQIACLEEIGFQQGWINRSQLEASITKMGASSYRAYLEDLLNN